MMTPLTASLAKYEAYHRNRRNIATHIVGIPMIVLAVIILLSRPGFLVAGVHVSPAVAAAAAVALFYLRLDISFGVVMSILLALGVAAGMVVAGLPTTTWLAAGGTLFVVGWILQLLGHFYERRKPAFLDDVAGLIVGPLFVVAEIAFALRLRSSLRDDVSRSAEQWSVR